MGRPVPGVEAAILARGEDGRAEVRDGQVTVVDRADHEGELALRPGWPSMFRGYLHDQASYRRVLCRRLVPHRRSRLPRR